MRLLDKLERHLGFLAIPGLIRIVVAFNALVFVLVRLNPDFQYMLDLNPSRIIRGELWRLVTYIFLPQTFSFLWVIFVLWFLWFIGEGLEQAWGAFRLTLYFFVGMIARRAAFFFGRIFPIACSPLRSSLPLPTFIQTKLSTSFHSAGDVKWVAWAMQPFSLRFVIGTNAYRMALVAALSNYVIFFGPGFFRLRDSDRK